jgi:hypothetical protein
VQALVAALRVGALRAWLQQQLVVDSSGGGAVVFLDHVSSAHFCRQRMAPSRSLRTKNYYWQLISAFMRGHRQSNAGFAAEYSLLQLEKTVLCT